MSYIDITKTLSESMNVWPGDSPFSYKSTMSITNGDSVNVGKIEMSTHTGTHLDAPYHYDKSGQKIDEIPIDAVCGECLVVDAVGVDWIDESIVENLNLNGVKKILFKTTVNKEGHSYENFPIFSENVPRILKQMGVGLIGTDAPSVDPLTSKELLAHHAFRVEGIYILEGVDLSDVVPNIYELIALPLKLKDGDGSPLRAVLKEIK
ncbi:cyclase family protein [Salipaludibacillus daqingensis]|uniref:cyclase family protein n=1 Tax=Salipaludibacillus daqingensis TaxID=3041001 RepID=UPI002476D84C|nr:cyclase family protein [Salipaludibacillus daqingensis]